jgi:RNA polymerase sigma-70 factor (ECF subfamily)
MSESTQTLEELAARAQGGQPELFHELAARVREPLRRFLTSRVAAPADADDLVQETLLRAYENLDRYDATRSFQTWLFTIGKRLAINHGQAAFRRQNLGEAAADRSDTVAPGSDVALEAQQLWRCARETLNEEQYRGLWLRYAQSYSIKEVARDLSRSVVSTKVLLHRARKRLLSEVS